MAKKIQHSDIAENDVFKPLIKGAKALNATLILINKQIDLNKDIIKDYAKVVEQSNEKTVKGQKDIEKGYSNVKTTTENLTEAEKERNKVLNLISENEKKLSIAVDQHVKANQIQNSQLKIQIEHQKDIIKWKVAEENSTNKLTAQNRILTKARNEQNLETEKGRRAVEKYNTLLDRNNAIIKQNADATKKQKLEIGNYPRIVDLATASLGDLKREFLALKNTSFTGKTTEEIAELKLRIGQLKDAMGDIQQEMQVMGTEKSAVVVSGLKLIAASVEGVVGTLSVFGVESEVIQNLEKKMTSLIAVTQALAEIEDAVSSGKLRAIGIRLQSMAIDVKDTVVKWSNVVASNAQVKAEEQRLLLSGKLNVLTRISTAIQWAWNTALTAFPIVAVVAGITALVGGITALVFWMNKEKEATIDVTKETKKYNDEAKRTNEIYELRLKYMELLGKSEKEKLQFEKELYTAEAKRLQIEYDLLKNGTTFGMSQADINAKNLLITAKHTQLIIAQTKATNADTKLRKLNTDEIVKGTNATNKWINEQGKFDKEAYLKSQKEAYDAMTQQEKDFFEWDMQQLADKQEAQRQSDKEQQNQQLKSTKTFTKQYQNLYLEYYATRKNQEQSFEDWLKEKRTLQFQKDFENLTQIVEGLTDIYKQQTDKRISYIDKEIEANKRRQDVLSNLANQQTESGKQNLAFELAREKQLELRRERALKKKQYLEAFNGLWTTFAGYAEKNPQTAFLNTAKDGKAMAGLLSTILSAKDGMEDTGRVANPLDADGGRLMLLHDNERILTKEQNQRIEKSLPNFSNEKVVSVIEQTARMEQEKNALRFMSNDAVIKRLDNLNATLENLPLYQGRDYDATQKAVIETIVSKFKVERNIQKIKC